MKKLFLLLIISMLITSFASALCTVTFDKDSYIAGETVTATMTCDSATEKNDGYQLNWTNETGYVFESDTGTTPSTTGQSFFETYIIPTSWPNGVFVNASLAGTDNVDLEGSDFANVSSTGGTAFLSITNVSITPYSELFLGKNLGIDFTVKDENDKKISGANCQVDLESGNGIPILASRDVSHDGRSQVNFLLDADAFDEGRGYRARIGCYCGGTGTDSACIDEDGTEVTNSIGSGSGTFATNTWLTVNTATGKSDYRIKEVMFVCANVTNVAYDKRVSMRLFYEVRCSSGEDNNDDLDRALIISDFQSPDIRGISPNTTQMQCKRFVIPEARYLEGKSSECYASTDVVVLDEEDDKVMSYHTTSPVFNITSNTLNIYTDWTKTQDYVFNTIINLSSDTYTDWNGSGIGNIDIKLSSILESLEAEKQKSFEGIDFSKMVASEYIKNITASNSTSTLTPYLEYLEDGALEIELRDVDITKDGWYNVTLYFNSFTERQADALEGIENKTGTFHLDVQCPSSQALGTDMNCSITAQIEDEQLAQKEVDFTCYITDGTNKYSAVNFNQMVTKTPVTLYQTFLVPINLTNGQQYVLQCYADYYNLGSRRDSFYDTFMAGTTSATESNDEGGSVKSNDNEAGENKAQNPITGAIIKILPTIDNTYVIVTTITALAILLISLILLTHKKQEQFKKFHKNKSKLNIKEIVIITISSVIGLGIILWLGKYILLGISKLWVFFATSNIIEDPLFRNILLATFIAVLTIATFKALKVKIDISVGREDPVQKYWGKLHKEIKNN